jgi:transposase
VSSAPSVVTETGIAARPVIDAEVLAVLAAAVDQAWPRPRVMATEATTGPSAWRFSGRWWSRPATSRRERPSTRD